MCVEKRGDKQPKMTEKADIKTTKITKVISGKGLVSRNETCLLPQRADLPPATWSELSVL